MITIVERKTTLTIHEGRNTVEIKPTVQRVVVSSIGKQGPPGTGGSFDGTLDDIPEGMNSKAFTAEEKTKLCTIEANATANDSDASLRDRSTHTGTQTASTISDFNTAADDRITVQKGTANGIVPLESDSKISTTYLPYSVLGATIYQGTWNANINNPALVSSIGTKGHYYVVQTEGTTDIDGIADWKLGDWIIFNGSVWEKVDNTDAVISVAGKTGAVSLNKSDVGLSNADNTSDVNKPISTATQTALDGKISSNPTGITGADQITNVISLTTAEYAAIVTPHSSTWYVITDA